MWCHTTFHFLTLQIVRPYLVDIINQLNVILITVPGVGKRSITENTLGINRRTLSDKLQAIGNTVTDTNGKSSLTETSLNNVKEDVDSIQTATNSITGKTDEIKATTDEADRKLTSVSTTSNHIIDRVRSIKGNTNITRSSQVTAGPILSTSDVKTDVIERLTRSLIALTSLMEQRLISLS